MTADFSDALIESADRNDHALRLPDPPTLSVFDLCVLHGEDPAAVARELKRDTALGRLVRKAFDCSERTPAAAERKKPLGRPRKDAAHRRDRDVVYALAEAMQAQERSSVGETQAIPDEAYYFASLIRAAEGRKGKKSAPIDDAGIRTSVRRRRRKGLGDLFAEAEVPLVDHLTPFLTRSKSEWYEIEF